MQPQDSIALDRSQSNGSGAPQDAAAVLEQIRSGEVKTVIIGGADHSGLFRAKRVPASRFAASDHPGIEFSEYMWVMDIEDYPQPSPKDFEGWWPDWATGFGDIEAVADLSTLRRVPWLPDTALVLCDYRYGDGRVYDLSPRDVLRGVVERYEKLGLEPRLAPELEFIVYDETEESAMAKGFRDLRPLSPRACPYGGLQATTDESVIAPIVAGLTAFGIPVETWNPEGSPGQYELNIPHHAPIEAADLGFLFKQGVKELCALDGKTATFMAKLSSEEYGSSLHVHQSVWRDGESAFHDGGAEYGMSPMFRHFVAGQLRTLATFMPIWMPTPNSYKRGGDYTAAGTTESWGLDNKSLTLRVLATDGKSCRLEHRVPGADANVYLVLAAMLAGGLYGIENELELPPPTLGDAYADPSVKRLPTTLHDSIEGFASSDVANEYLGEEFVRRFAATRRWEVEQSLREISEWELKRYFVRG